MSSYNKWKLEVQKVDDIAPHLRAVQSPISVGGRLLDAGRLDVLYDATKYDKLRLGVFKLTLQVPGSRGRRCILCASGEHGIAHLLAQCSATDGLRAAFYDGVDQVWRARMQGAPSGDWPTVVLSPHQGLNRLLASVQFGANLADMLAQMD
jgi:hypothetical protein